MSRTANYHRGYERQLLEKGNVTLAPRTIEIPEGCWFCGRVGAKMTKARLFPDWLLEALNAGNQMMSSAHFDPTGKLIDQRPASLKSLVCGQVCQDCNNGWMSRLDSSFKKSFLGNVEAEQAKHPLLFARWVAKTATLINVSQQYRLQIPAAARHGLQSQDSLPKGWRVYAFTLGIEESPVINWAQGTMPTFTAPESKMDELKKEAGNIFSCAIKINNFGAVAFWHPDSIYQLEPAYPMRRLWPKAEGGLSPMLWSPYATNFCVVDMMDNKDNWLENLSETRASVARHTAPASSW